MGRLRLLGDAALGRLVVVADVVGVATVVLLAEDVVGRDDVGALRVKLHAFKNANPALETIDTMPQGRKFDPRVVLELDYWLALPRS